MSIRLVRFFGGAVAVSLVSLLVIAMPLKYFFNQPEFVAIIGAIHGGLLFVYAITIIVAKFNYSLPFLRSLVMLVIGMIPFGSFYNEWFIRKNMLLFVKKSE